MRARYAAGTVNGRHVKNYRDEPDVARDSQTETYVAMKLLIDNWRWADVPFYIRTGKALATRRTEIAIKFKQVPYAMFRDLPQATLPSNELVLHVQPEEGLSINFQAKVPGQQLAISGVKMNIRYADYFQAEPNTGYETLIYDCMTGDATLFQRADNIESGWAAVQPILDAWQRGYGPLDRIQGRQRRAVGRRRSARPRRAALEGAVMTSPIDASKGPVDNPRPPSPAGPIRFLVSDVDGTLVTPDKTITPAARDAVRALRDAGVGFAFVSSRPPRGLVAIADALGLHAPGGAAPVDRRPAAAAFNGGLLLDESLQTISFEPLPTADAQIAIDLFVSLGIDVWVFTPDEWLVTDPAGHYVAHERHTVGFDARVVDDFAGLGPDTMRRIGKIVGSHPDPALLQRAAVALSLRLSPDARAALSQTYYLDVTNAKANKGTALETIAAHAGVALDEIAAIGDMTNDIAMLDIAGFSIAMGNAPDSMKNSVDAVTATNEQDGFAKAVTELVLPRVAKDAR